MNLSPKDLRRAADIKEQIEALQGQLNSCLAGGSVGSGFGAGRTAKRGGYVGNGFAPRLKRGRMTGGKTVADSILEALSSGNPMPVSEIIRAASTIRGRAISPGLMSVTLAQLKKTKRVANPARGQYQRR